MHLPIPIQKFLLVSSIQFDKLIELQFAKSVPVVQTHRMDHDVAYTIVLRVENHRDILMYAGFALSDHIFFGFDALTVLNRNLLRVQLLYLLVIEQQIGLKHEFLLESRYVSLDPEVADVVQLHLLLVISQQK